MMVQKRKIERRCIDFQGNVFKPLGIPMKDLDEVRLTKEELTALQYAHIEGLKQQDAAEKMGISQSSFSRDLAEAHFKIADALLNTKALFFEKEQIEEDEEKK